MIKRLLTGAALTGAGLVAWRAVRRRSRQMDFGGRVVLITGGSRGLGLELARRFAYEGARLVLVARTEADLEKAAGELRGRGADVLVAAGDVGNAEDMEAIVRKALERYGRLDVLVHVAGVIQVGPREHMKREDFEEAMDVHFWGAHNLVQAALPHLERGARIVNISSIGGLVAVPHLLPYAASKFALTGYSDGLRAELRHRGIYVTTVCPGLMRTGSHVNAFFKGQHRREFALFSLSAAAPPLSLNADHAAEKIVRACRRGDPFLTYTVPARLAIGLNRLLPDAFAELTALVAQLLPSEAGAEGDERRTGWESFSRWAPSRLTRPADRAVPDNNERRGHAPPASEG